MKVIELKDKVIYRPESGKKVKFSNNEKTYTVIIVSEKTDKIVEVDR